MAVNDFDIGKQGRMDIVSDGAILDSAQVINFTAAQETVTITSRPLGRPKVTKEVPDGWKGSFDIDRLGPVFDDYFAQAEEDYWSNTTEPDVILTQTVKEKNGSLSQYRYEDVALKFDDVGTYKQDDKVMQKVSYVASRRRKIA